MESETRIFEATHTNLSNLLTWVHDLITTTSFNPSDKMHIELAVEEAVVNVIVHSKEKKPIQISLTFRHKPFSFIEFDICDNASPFNPLAQSEKNFEDLPLEQRLEGGAGLLLIKKCTDALYYRRENDQNILTLVKNYSIA